VVDLPDGDMLAAAEALGHDMSRDVVTPWAQRWKCTRCFCAAWNMVDHFDGAALEQTCDAARAANAARTGRSTLWSRLRSRLLRKEG
jgi:hypothetical protein